MAVNDAGHAGDQVKVALLNNPVFRSWMFQILLVAILGWLFFGMYENLDANREAQNIKTGFGFLSNEAGFAISFSPFLAYSENSTYLQTFFVGLQNTLFLAVIGIFFATIVGFLVGVGRLSQNWIIAKLSYVYVETFRNIPLLLQIFIWYKGVLATLPSARASIDMGFFGFLNTKGMFVPKPIMAEGAGMIFIAALVAVVAGLLISRWAKKRQMNTGERFPVFWTFLGLLIFLPVIAYFLTGQPISLDAPTAGRFGPRGGMTLTPELLSLALALALYTAAFIAEIVRAGILAVDKGQSEASYALGLTRGQTLRLNVIPQAMRVIIPPLTSQFLNLTKNSSLAVAIAYPDLTAVFAGTALNQAGQAVEFMLITMFTYLLISLVTSVFMNWFNARMALVER